MALTFGERRVSESEKIHVRHGLIDVRLNVGASHVSFSELCAGKCHSALGAELTAD
jgi:hypothetical protein